VKVYIAGPMRGYPEYNFPAFLDAEDRVSALGHEVLSPARHTLDAGFDPRYPLENQPGFGRRKSLRWCVAAVLDSERVVTLDGWEHSPGARAEVALAYAVPVVAMPLATFLSCAVEDKI
jgi:hypothetical protein